MIQFLADPTQHDNALKLTVGFKEIDGKLWHFEQNGCASAAGAWFEAIQNGRNGWYYCVEEGVVATGFHTIGDERFYFAEKNSPATFSDGKVREVGELVQNCWFQIPAGEYSGWYRANLDGQLNRGVLPWNVSDRYFFDQQSGKCLFSVRKSGEKLYGYAPGKGDTLLTGFHTDHEGHRYYFAVRGDGISSLAVSELAQGWFHIQNGADAGWYYADNMGVLNTGELVLENENRYFFDAMGKSLFSIRNAGSYKYGFAPGPDTVTDKVYELHQSSQGDYYYFLDGDGRAVPGDVIISSSLNSNIPTKYFFDEISRKSLTLRLMVKNGKSYIGDFNGNALTGKQTIAVLVYYEFDKKPQVIEVSFDAADPMKGFSDALKGDGLNGFGSYVNCSSIYGDIYLNLEQLFGFVTVTQGSGAPYTAYYYDPKHPDSGVSKGQKAINQNITVNGKSYTVSNGKVLNYDGEGLLHGLRCFFEKGRSIKKANYWYQEADGAFYHYNAGLTPDTGWLDNGKYYLGTTDNDADLSKGQLATGWRQINNKWYYFGDYNDGSKLTLGEVAHGFRVIGSNTYYFGEKNPENGLALTAGEMATGWQTFAAGVYYFGTPDDETLDDGVMAEGFHAVQSKKTNKEDLYYFATRDDANKTPGTRVVGWHKILDDWFYFDTHGVMMTGWLVLGDKTYYLSDGDDNHGYNYGAMASGWHHIGDKKFYFGVPGDQTNLAEGQLAVGPYTIAGTQYYFAKSADTVTKTIKGEMATGWQQRGDAHYYYGSRMEESSLAEGQMARYTVNINGRSHYFSGDGSAYSYSGNSWLNNYNAPGAPVTWYLLEKSEFATGWHTIEGKKYYFGSPAKSVGWMQEDKPDGSGLSVGEIAIGFKEINGERYYFADGTEGFGLVRGECASGWFQLGGKTYHADPESGALNRSVLNINGRRYFFDKTGCSLFCIDDEGGGTGSGPGSDRSNPLINALAYDGNGTGYCFDASARLRRGWYTVTAPVKGRVYGGSPGDGTTLGDYQLATGFQTIEGKLYHFNEKGLMSTGWFMVGGNWYRYDEGLDQVNRGVLKWDGNQYYHFDTLTGKFLYMFMVGADGSHTAYHYDASSNYKKYSQSGWTADRQYYLDGDMKAVTGWQHIDNKSYYFNPGSDGFGKIKTGFQMFDGKQYYLGVAGDGTGLTEGEMARYTVRINDRLHYFQGDGVAHPANSWLSDNNKTPIVNTWYVLDKGELAFGWETVDGHDYFFDPLNGCRLDPSTPFAG
jgi:glucan-binding YG repeat protein